MSAMIVPNEWEVVEIQKLVKITTGNKDTQDSNKYGLYPFFVRSQTIERINSYSFDGEAILTAGDGVGVGKVFHHVNGKFDFHQRVYCLSHFDQNVDPKFLFEYFKTNFIKQVNKYSAKGSVDSVRFDMIAKMLMPLPPKFEQQKIATILSTLDRTIEATQKLIDKEKMVKKGLMADLLTHGIDEQGRIRSPQTHTYVDSPLGMIPQGWAVKLLKELGDCINGLTYSPDDVVDYDGILVLRSSNIQGNKLAFEDNVYVRPDMRIKDRIQANDILICVRNGSKALIGKNALITEEVHGQAHGAFMTVFRTQDYKYVFQLFQSDMYTTQVEKNLGATINSINNSDLLLFSFPMPCSSNEMQKITTILSAQDRKIETEEINLAKLQNLKKGLMGDLLSGDVRVKG